MCKLACTVTNAAKRLRHRTCAEIAQACPWLGSRPPRIHTTTQGIYTGFTKGCFAPDMHHESRFITHRSRSIQLISPNYCKDFGLETPNRVPSCMDRESVQVTRKKPVRIQEPEAIFKKQDCFSIRMEPTRKPPLRPCSLNGTKGIFHAHSRGRR